MKEFKDKLLEAISGYFGEDMYDIFGKDIETMLVTARNNYIKDNVTKWENVECIQSLDFMNVVTNVIINILKEDKK